MAPLPHTLTLLPHGSSPPPHPAPLPPGDSQPPHWLAAPTPAHNVAHTSRLHPPHGTEGAGALGWGWGAGPRPECSRESPWMLGQRPGQKAQLLCLSREQFPGLPGDVGESGAHRILGVGASPRLTEGTELPSFLIYLFPFILAALRHMEFPGQGSDLSHRCDLCHSCGNTGSLTHCAGPGIKPVS